MTAPAPQPVKMTTPGEWIVTTIDRQIVVVKLSHHIGIADQTIATFGDEDAHNADEHIANAALLSVSKDMLEALIAIQHTLNTSKYVVNLEAINQTISNIFAKLANEAGEEL